jgi:hypothetical protein
MGSPQEAFDQARADAWLAFKEGTQSYQDAYDKAMADALAEFNAAMGLETEQEEEEEEDESSAEAPTTEMTFDLGPAEEE